MPSVTGFVQRVLMDTSGNANQHRVRVAVGPSPANTEDPHSCKRNLSGSSERRGDEVQHSSMRCTPGTRQSPGSGYRHVRRPTNGISAVESAPRRDRCHGHCETAVVYRDDVGPADFICIELGTSRPSKVTPGCCFSAWHPTLAHGISNRSGCSPRGPSPPSLHTGADRGGGAPATNDVEIVTSVSLRVAWPSLLIGPAVHGDFPGPLPAAANPPYT
jgi:hypothetical protein